MSAIRDAQEVVTDLPKIPRCVVDQGATVATLLGAASTAAKSLTCRDGVSTRRTLENTLTIGPITYISINLGPKVGANDSLAGVRVVPAGRNGNRVYGRTLKHGEPDSGEGIPLEVGETLEFPAGSVSVTMADVDRYSEQGPDGYAPVANTVWTWLAIPPFKHDQVFVNYLLAAARRLDAAHAHCSGALRGLPKIPNELGFRAREAMFDALGDAESMCVALSRAIRMIARARATISAPAAIPEEVSAIEHAVLAIRDAFEHIDERAVGKARREDPSDAMSVFDQSDFFTSGVLRYAGHSLDIREEAIPALIAGRKFIVEAATEAGLTKTIKEPIAWTFTAE